MLSLEHMQGARNQKKALAAGHRRPDNASKATSTGDRNGEAQPGHGDRPVGLLSASEGAKAEET